MPKKKRPEEKPEAQFKRFIETARELEVEETGEDLARAFKRVASSKHDKQRGTRG